MLWPGNAGPAPASPPRTRCSVRRTMTVDGHRPEGPAGPVRLDARGRDLFTDARGDARVLDHAVVLVEADTKWDVRSLSATPDVPELSILRGVSARHGFRRAVRDVLPGLDGDGSVLMALLEEIPIIVSLSRLALIAKGAMRPGDRPPGTAPATAGIGAPICAGWVQHGQLALRSGADGPTLLTEGVVAPAVVRDDDPLGWHDVAPMVPEGFRRRRRYDVALDGGKVVIDGWFRDSYLADDGYEVALHEYTVETRLDPTTLIVTECSALDRVLPGPECRDAALSVARLVGHPLDAVPNLIRDEFTGVATCTHLNDALYALGGVHGLAARSPRSEGDPGGRSPA
jgi:hypothetical protein